MANKTKVTPQKDKVPEKEGQETPSDSPLLELSDAAVKKLIRSAKKRGYVTHDQINSVLRSEEVNSEQIEDVLAMFSEMGIVAIPILSGLQILGKDTSSEPFFTRNRFMAMNIILLLVQGDRHDVLVCWDNMVAPSSSLQNVEGLHDPALASWELYPLLSFHAR